MYSLPVEILWLCAGLSQGLWAYRIGRLQLVQSRPFLFSYLISTVVSVVMSLLTRAYGSEDLSTYRSFWSWTQPLFWTLTLLVLVETYNHVLGRLSGFRSVGQTFMRVASIGVAAVYLWMIFGGSSPQSWYAFWLAHRWGLFVAAAVFFCSIAVFSKLLRTPLSSNDKLVIVVFGLLVGGTALSTTLREILGPDVQKTAGVIMPMINLLTCVYAAVKFSKEGEAPVLEERLPGDEKEMLRQLDIANEAIGRSLRK